MRTDYIVIDDPQKDGDAKSELTANCGDLAGDRSTDYIVIANCGDLAGGRSKQNKERR